MSLVPSFSAQQLVGIPSSITLTDTSTGSDGSIVARKVYIQKADGTYLTNGSTWALVNSTITLDVMTQDEALNIRVDWVDNSNAVLYTYEDTFEFNQYNNQFDIDLTRAILSNPAIMQDKDYWLNRMILRVNIDSADQSISLADDISLAQSCNDRATFLRLRQNLYF